MDSGDKVNKTTILKLSSIICFLFILVALILIRRNPSQGYEVSIYSAIPSLIWVLLISAIVGGAAIVVYQVLKSKETRNWWKVGLLLILLSNLIIALLPALRGYAFSGRADHLSHFGAVKDILQFGNFSSNVYPLTHTLISQFCLVLNIPSMNMMCFAAPLFYLLFVAFTYLLYQEILPKPAAILATVSSTMLFCYYYVRVVPFGFAAIMFPLIFFLYFKAWNKPSLSLKLLVISLIGLIVFFHPVTSLVLTLSLIIIELSKPLFNRLFIAKKKQEPSTSAGRISLSLVAISFIVLMLWVWNNYNFWSNSVVNTFRWFSGELLRPAIDRSLVEYTLSGFAKLGLGPLGQLELLIRAQGHIIICLLLALMTIIMILRRRIPLSIRYTQSVFSLSIIFWVIATAGLLSYFRALTILNSGRLMYYIFSVAPPLIGMSLYWIIGIEHRNGGITGSYRPRFYKSKLTRGIAIISIIMVCFVICIFAIYPSPSTYQRNPQVSHMEMAGASWFLNKRDTQFEFMDIGGAITPHFERAVHGNREANYPERMNTWLGDHFNYTQYESFGESFTEDRYLILNEHDKVLYTEVWPTGRFNWSDFTRLEKDPSVDKLYVNGEMDAWYVRGSQEY